LPLSQNFAFLSREKAVQEKEGIARRIHDKSPRSSKPFVALNCSAIPESLVESILFGHEKGAFTGAHQRHIGKFEEASGGTLFLDEIGDMPLPTQAKLLRALQEGEVTRVGGQDIVAKPRVIAATNQDLEKAVEEGRFRKDLYFRLCSKATVIHLPPLRERKTDIPLLAEHFVKVAAAELELPKPTFSKDAVQVIQEYSWPGNVRELENAMLAGVVMARKSANNTITPDMLKLEVGAGRQTAAHSASLDAPVEETFGYKLSVKREERGWTQTKLAKKAGRQALREITDKEIAQWENNNGVPEQDIINALAYVLIMDMDKPARDRAKALEEFFDAADVAVKVGVREQGVVGESAFGDMLRDAREKAGLTQAGLAEKLLAMSGKVGLGQKEIYLIEQGHAGHKLVPSEALALVQAMDTEDRPLSSEEKVDLYDRARKVFAENKRAAGNGRSIEAIKKSLSELFENEFGSRNDKALAKKTGLDRGTIANLFDPRHMGMPSYRTIKFLGEDCKERDQSAVFNVLVEELTAALQPHQQTQR